MSSRFVWIAILNKWQRFTNAISELWFLQRCLCLLILALHAMALVQAPLPVGVKVRFARRL